MNITKQLFAKALLPAMIASMAASGSWAQEQQMQLEEVVVTGTRREGVDPSETLSPVDVVGGEALTGQASFNLTDSLTKLAPSLNTQRFPIADGTAFVRPVTLRNLSPDQTLVLVDGTLSSPFGTSELTVGSIGYNKPRLTGS